MGNLKIFHGLQHGPQSGENDGSPRSHSGHDPEHHDSRPQTSYSHDKTPARQREFESQGFQNRSLFDGPSNQRGNQSYGPQSNGHHHHSDDPLGLKGLLNLRSDNSSGRGELLSNRNNGRSFAESGQPGAQTNAYGDHGDHGDHGGGRVSKDPGREFDRGWDFRATDLSSSDRHDGLLRTLTDTVRTESNQARNQLRFLDGEARNLPPGQAKRWNENLPSQHHGEDHSPDNYLRTLGDTVRTELNEGRFLDNDARSLPPGQAKRWSDNLLLQPHGQDHSQDNLLELRSTLKDVFRSVSDQLRTVTDDVFKTSRGLDRPEYGNRLANRLVGQIDYALENRVLRDGPHERIVREITSEVATVVQLGKYFSQLEPTGGEPVRQAYRAVLDFLLRPGTGDTYDRLRFAAEILRDLQSGVFLFREDLEGPFPLTGRARVVSEMIELMRTLDAVEAYTEAMRLNGMKADWPLLQPGGLSGLELMAVLEQLLTEQGPMFPGVVGRLEIPRLLAQLDGLLNSADGKPLLMVDGKPLRVGDLLWLNLLTSSATLGADRMGAKLSAPFLYGLDSVFTLIGFDGRSLSVPHFLAIQSQINAFNFDWVSGQAPLSEGWMRLVIESLKDSRIFDHNVLGEMLEEALTNGTLHLLVMRGTVENGKPVPGSFSFSPVYDLHGKVVAATS